MRAFNRTGHTHTQTHTHTKAERVLSFSRKLKNASGTEIGLALECTRRRTWKEDRQGGGEKKRKDAYTQDVKKKKGENEKCSCIGLLNTFIFFFFFTFCFAVKGAQLM